MAKVALVAVLAGSGVVAGEAAMERVNGSDAAPPPAAGSHRSDREVPAGSEAAKDASDHGVRMSTERSHGRRGAERSAERSNGHSNAGTRSKPARDRSSEAGGRKLGQIKRTERSKSAEPRGRGQSDALAREQAKPPAQRKAPAPRPAPQPKAQSQPSPPVSEPVAAPEPAPLPAPKSTPPGQVKLSK